MWWLLAAYAADKIIESQNQAIPCLRGCGRFRYKGWNVCEECLSAEQEAEWKARQEKRITLKAKIDKAKALRRAEWVAGAPQREKEKKEAYERRKQVLRRCLGELRCLIWPREIKYKCGGCSALLKSKIKWIEYRDQCPLCGCQVLSPGAKN